MSGGYNKGSVTCQEEIETLYYAVGTYAIATKYNRVLSEGHSIQYRTFRELIWIEPFHDRTLLRYNFNRIGESQETILGFPTRGVNLNHPVFR